MIDAESGVVIKATVNVKEFGTVPYSFDVIEFRDHYGYLSDTIDVLDIAYTLPDGTREKPEPDARMAIMRARYFEAAHLLSLLGFSARRLISKRKPGGADSAVTQSHADAAVSFLARVNYAFEDEQPEDDPARLPDGVILSSSNSGPCAGCHCHIRTGERVLLDTINSRHYCTRECLDLNRHG